MAVYTIQLLHSCAGPKRILSTTFHTFILCNEERRFTLIITFSLVSSLKFVKIHFVPIVTVDADWETILCVLYTIPMMYSF